MFLEKIADSNCKIPVIVGTFICALLANVCFALPAHAQQIDSGHAETYPASWLFNTALISQTTSVPVLARSNFKSRSTAGQPSQAEQADADSPQLGENQQSGIAHTVSTSDLGDNQSIRAIEMSTSQNGGAELSSASISAAVMNGLEVGGTIYNDINRNGLKDPTEPGIRNVDIEVYADADGDNWPDGPVLAIANSGLSGNYRFSGLGDGDYVMNIAAPFFAQSQPLYQLVACPPSSTSNDPIDPDNDVDGDNNAVEYITGLGVKTMRTLGVTLNTGAEPTTEDADPNTNLTVDLCFQNDSVQTPTLPNGEPDLEPEAADDEYVREINTGLDENILVNDTAGNGPLLVRFVSGTIAPGLTLNAGGDLEGTVTQAGEYVFEYEISDYDGDTSTAFVTVTVESDLLPVAEDDSLATNIGDIVSLDICENDFFGSGFGSVAYVSGQIAPGLSLEDCIVSGVPTTAGTFVFDYILTDTDGDTDTATVTIYVNVHPIAVDDSATVATNTQLTLDICANDSFSDGFGSVTFLSGTIPPGTQLDQCILDGIPNTPGEFVFVYELADADGDTDTATVTIDVNLLPDAIDDSASALADVPFSLDISANDNLGDGFGSITLVSGVLPPGLTLNGRTISGVPTTLGEYVFEYELEDIDGDTDRAIVTITIAQEGTITIVKETTSGDGTFTFNSDDAEMDQLRITTSNGTGSSPQFTRVADTYIVSEVPLVGWALDNIRISGDTDGGSSTSGNTAVIDLDPGENIVITFIGSSISACADGTSNLGGVVWRDFNNNGLKDANDVGFYDANIMVYAYNATNTEIASTSLNPDGTYFFAGIFNLSSTVRVEFTGLPNWAHSSISTADNGTTVQHHRESTCTADLAVHNPSDYCQANPNLATSCFVNGDPQSDGAELDAFVMWPYESETTGNAVGADTVHLGAVQQLGTTWGVAYKRDTSDLYIASFLRRHAGLGPLGLGGIYVIDPSNTAPANDTSQPYNWLDVHGLDKPNGGTVDVGTVPARDLTTIGAPNNDSAVYSLVSKIGLGDIEISEDGSTLYVMNLNHTAGNAGELLAIDIAGKTIIGVYPIPLTLTRDSVGGGSPSSGGADLRPWAIKIKDGAVYVGVVDSAESTKSTSDLHAWVLRLDGSAFQQVFDMALNYPRGSWPHSYIPANWDYAWNPWFNQNDPWPPIGDVGGYSEAPQPFLSDIEFDVNGDMILGIGDRFGYQAGADQPGPTPGDRFINATSLGDILRACGSPATGWTLESNAACGDVTTAGANSVDGFGGPVGPGGGEWYYQDAMLSNNTGHFETVFGGLALLPGSDEVVAAVSNPKTTFSGGVSFYSSTSGEVNRSYTVYRSRSRADAGKSAGLGDIEMICEPTPIEIGDYVWQDRNRDGIQTPNENGIAAVMVELYNVSGAKIATTVTDGNGQYTFNTGNVPDGLDPYTQYQVKIDLTQAATADMSLTQPNVNGGTQQPDAVDSDAIMESGLAVVSFTTTGGGQNDHTIDFGLVGNDSILACANGTNDLEGQVWRDFNSNGIRDGNDLGFYDENITVYAYDATNRQIASTTLNNDGTYVFENVFRTADAVRIEFDGFPSWIAPSALGSDNGTMIQHHRESTCRADLAIQNPADYCQSDPTLALACMENGQAQGNTNPAYVTLEYHNPTTKNALLQVADLGAVWGAAYHPTSENVFLSSLMRRHSGFANGPGYIYVVQDNNLIQSVNLHGILPTNGGGAINLGSVCRRNATDGDTNAACDPLNAGLASDYELPINPATPNVDLDAFNAVGKVSFGDIDITEDGKTLWAVNLKQRALISVDISADGTIATDDVSQYLLTTLSSLPVCRNGVFRPWALEFNDGAGYLGGVCSAENGGGLADLKAHVLRFDPENIAGGFANVLNFDLDFNREPFYDYITNTGWKMWIDDWSNAVDNREHPQPMLSDIEFMGNGSMVLGFGDRFGLQLGAFNWYPYSGSTTGNSGSNTGDILYACNVNGAFVLEGSSGCIIDNDSGDSWWSAKADDGPAGIGEFFYQDDARIHQETSQGALIVLKQNTEVVATRSNPENRVFTSGLAWYSTIDGTKNNGFEIVARNGASNFGKAANLSDVVAMCRLAPTGIGNYVWLDSNRDGIQNPDETGIAGVTVTLYNANDTQVASTVTDSLGQYSFNEGNVPNGLASDAQYQVRISLSQQAVNGLVPTVANADGGTANPSRIDSDGLRSGNNAVSDVTTTGAGHNNYAVDFGFTPPQSVSCGTMSQEAEDALLSGAFTTVTENDGASGGQHIWVPPGTGNLWNGADDAHSATFCIEVEETGLYRVVGTAQADSNTSNSLYMTVDGIPENGYLWDIELSDNYIEDYVNHRSVADPIEVILSAGQHIIGVHSREDGIRLDKMALELIEPTLPSPTCAGMEQEAENGALHGNFLSHVDEFASGGLYVGVQDGLGSNMNGSATIARAEYCFTVPESGTYELVGTINAVNANADSFYVTVDGQPTTGYLWDTQRSRVYIEDSLNDRDGANPVLLNLAAGYHNIVVYLREDGTRLDKIKLVPSATVSAAETPDFDYIIKEENVVYGMLHVPMSHEPEPDLAGHTVTVSGAENYEATTNHIGGYYVDDVQPDTYNVSVTVPTESGDVTLQKTITVDAAGSGTNDESVEVSFEVESPTEFNPAEFSIYLPTIR